MMSIAGLIQEFHRSLMRHESPDRALDDLLIASCGRATGLWRVDADRLELLGFRGVADMADDVKHDFAAATASVSLDQTNLGIVKATVTREPTDAEIAMKDGELFGSAGWLERFQCPRSLAVPILMSGTVVGVLAVSTAGDIGPGTDERMTILAIAAELGPILAR